MIQLTGVPHPDINNGEQTPVFIDESRVLVIEQSTTQFTKRRSAEKYRQAVQGLHQEVERVRSELSETPPMVPTTENEAEQIRRWVQAKDCAGALQAAYGLVANAANHVESHPPVDCTCVSLACGTGLEHGVMLSRVFVTESPAEVAHRVQNKIQPA